MKMLSIRYSALLPALVNVFLSTGAYAQAEKSSAATIDNAGNDHLLWLFAATLGVALCIAVWQLSRVRRAKRQHEHSALADAGKSRHDSVR